MLRSSVRSGVSLVIRLGLVACVLLNLACGGRDTGDDDGGGGGGGGGNQAAITQGTAEAMAGAVVRATFLSGDVPDIIDSAIPPDTGALQASDELPGRDIPASLPRAAFGPSDVPCGVSGDVELSGDVADPNTYSAGDDVNGDYQACDFGTGYEYDGLMDFSIVSLTGNLLGASFDVTLDVLLDTFLVDDGSGTLRLDGSPTLDLDSTGAPLYVSSVDATSLSLLDGATTYTLRDFVTDLEVDASGTPSYVFTSDGDMTSSVFTGQVTYTTLTDFEGDVGSPPSIGRMRITGASNASIRIDPVDDVDVDLNVDLDGNGSIDVLIGTTWAALGL